MPRKEHEHDRTRGLDKDARDSAHYRKVLKIDAEDDSKSSQVGDESSFILQGK